VMELARDYHVEIRSPPRWRPSSRDARPRGRLPWPAESPAGGEDEVA
ncbi:hypothetical protein GS415_08635, partial [Rhodococcus hoagii]|nr:hypothetical protein [Prescottella equi]